MMRALFMAALLAVPAMSAAQTATSTGDAVQDQPPQRIRSVLLTPGQKCPPAQGNEIVVCAPLEEPYRIPQALRRTEPTAENRSWVARAEIADDVSRRASGVPNSCSPTGSGGQTGCTQALLEQWTQEMRARANGQAIP